MRPVHKTALFKFIQEKLKRLPDDFVYKDGVVQFGKTCTELRFKNSSLSFYIAANPNDYNYYMAAYTVYSPTHALLPFQGQYVNFETIIAAFAIWVTSSVKNYLEDQAEPDYWENYLEASRRLDITKIEFAQKDEFFSEREKSQLNTVLQEYKTLLIETFNPLSEQIEEINERIDYLIAATDRLNKFDWKGTMINTLITIGVALTLSPEQGKTVLELFLALFHRFLSKP